MQFRWQIDQPLAGTLAHIEEITAETSLDVVVDAITTAKDDSPQCPFTKIPMGALRTHKHTWVTGRIGGSVGGEVVRGGGWIRSHVLNVLGGV